MLATFERDSITKLVAGDTETATHLQQQLRIVRVTERHMHGLAGFLTVLQVPNNAPLVTPSEFAIADVVAFIPGVDLPVTLALFVKDGRMDALDATFREQHVPNPLVTYELRYINEPRHHELLGSP